MKRFAFVLALAALLVVSAPAGAQEQTMTENLDPPGGQELVPGQCSTPRKFIGLGSPPTSAFGYANTFCPPNVVISSVPRIHRWYVTVAQGNWCLAAGTCHTSVYGPPGMAPGAYWMSVTLQLIAPVGWTFPSGSGLCTGYGTNHLTCIYTLTGVNIAP